MLFHITSKYSNAYNSVELAEEHLICTTVFDFKKEKDSFTTELMYGKWNIPIQTSAISITLDTIEIKTSIANTIDDLLKIGVMIVIVEWILIVLNYLNVLQLHIALLEFIKLHGIIAPFFFLIFRAILSIHHRQIINELKNLSIIV